MNSPTAKFSQLNIGARARAAIWWLADSERLPKLQRLLLIVLVLWAVNSVVDVVVALLPSS